MAHSQSVIVGGSSGIGFATAKMLLAQGHQVVIAGRDERKLQEAKKSLGGGVSAFCLNAADRSSIETAFSHIGSFDNLVLALGSHHGLGAFPSVALSDVRQGFEEKVFPHFATAQAALKYLTRRGSITFVSAITAHVAMPGTAGIGAANAAIAAMVPTLAQELKPMRVNAVSPGVVDTPWWDFLGQTQKAAALAEYGAKAPVGRVGTADDIAQAITFLISNTFMTGQVIVCDGGVGLSG